jgi:hypothetical protein
MRSTNRVGAVETPPRFNELAVDARAPRRARSSVPDPVCSTPRRTWRWCRPILFVLRGWNLRLNRGQTRRSPEPRGRAGALPLATYRPLRIPIQTAIDPKPNGASPAGILYVAGIAPSADSVALVLASGSSPRRVT